jgi:hypothetical protein
MLLLVLPRQAQPIQKSGRSSFAFACFFSVMQMPGLLFLTPRMVNSHPWPDQDEPLSVHPAPALPCLAAVLFRHD